MCGVVVNFSLSIPLLASVSVNFISNNARVCAYVMDVNCVWGLVYFVYNCCY